MWEQVREQVLFSRSARGREQKVPLGGGGLHLSPRRAGPTGCVSVSYGLPSSWY